MFNLLRPENQLKTHAFKDESRLSNAFKCSGM